MTKPDEPDLDPGDDELPALTEPEEREVAALLAALSARSGPVTTPPAVAARLDDVLAGLVADRRSEVAAEHVGAAKRGSSVVPLAPAASRPTRQRRRLLAGTLLAAAAVVVGGYAVGNLPTTGTLAGGGSSASDTAGGSGESAAGGGTQAGRESAATGGQARSDTAPEGEELSVVPTVRQDRLAADVRRVERLFGSGTAGDPEDGSGEQRRTTDETRDCPVPRLTEQQRLYEVRFRGEPSGLVVGPRQQQRVVVTLYSCSTGGVELTRTLPAAPRARGD